ncbi:histidine utilization repressor [Rhizobiales bacterium RZME27]|uniref:Histidine utilization repressor n=1 Tax=Endobacterium cereale TaxID=2663029 RepID=A0A6A8AC67_9HYPH|nr:histidine utilization repressor [Endobacterium cereale]MEB2845476.1 histidine utilization repressor [Endobacterium cereale]MQY48895.1 histidine utilization repressor [Endobacterium cereale]
MKIVRDATLHQRILGDIEARIVSGEWPPGHRIPFEVDLAADYNCSRMTANKVLTQLAKSGLIERRKKSGSFVAQPRAQSAVLAIAEIEAEVQSLRLSYSHIVHARSKRRANAADKQRLELSEAASVLDITCIHQAGAAPFCLEERLISLATVPEAEAETFDTVSPGTWLLKRVPWSAAENRISAVSAGASVAILLDIEKGTACLVIERRTWSPAGPVTSVRLTYPGDRHALVAKFAPGGEG